MAILVVGGAGYIGSHVCKSLHAAGFTPVVYDNLSNGHAWAVRWGPLVQGDLLDPAALEQVFQKYAPVAVIHLASCIDVRESMTNPGKYYHNNVTGSLHLLQAMVRHQVLSLVFSSTAAVYGNPEQTPIHEDHPCRPINVYGKTKWIVEEMLNDFLRAYEMRSVILRYFNAAGAEGEIGEAHSPETHLIPRAILAMLGKMGPLQIFGNNHPTSDGTPIRDFIHVADLARAHVQAVQWLLQGGDSLTLNLGSGQGCSVTQVISMIEEKSGAPVPCELAPRNLSDPPILVAAIEKAKKELHWTPRYSDLATIISTALEWHRK